jgi:lysophospholipase L1-like esterase
MPTPSETGAVLVAPDHPWVAYVGRVDRKASGGPLLGFVGASVRVRFQGTGLELRLKDFGGGTSQTANYYDVSIDGAAPGLLETSPSRNRYTLAQGLPEGEHEVELFKRVECAPGGSVGAGKGQVLGFLLYGRELLPPRLSARRLEFVGDSITCGYGNEVSTDDPDNAPYTSRSSNGHKAYGALTAALLGAQYSAVAYSGRGMSRNYGGGGGQVLPDMYLDSVPEEPTASRWDPASYVPDAVIINLGTNDFWTPGLDRPAFVERYTAFLASLRGYYPKAALVAANGPMLNDQDPPGEPSWTHARADVQAAVAARRKLGDENVHILVFQPQTGPYGQDWHPTLATHERLARELTQSLRGILGW